jgi:ubiquinone/menaquinone biosynthesis C-methylase UbiE
VPIPQPGQPLTSTALPAIPGYLHETYTWAYVSPEAIRRFERQWLVNLILWGNFGRLRDLALDSFGQQLDGRSLQVACVYGNLTAHLAARHRHESDLDVIDIIPAQIDNLKRKLGPDSNVNIQLANSAALPHPSATCDRALLFFLLHEQPLEVRCQTIREAFRVVRPGGKIIFVDYHRPSGWHPLRAVMYAILSRLEPYALDLWHSEIAAWFPADMPPASIRKRTCFGQLYQIVEVIR